MKTDGRTLLFSLLIAAFLLTPGMLSAQRRGSGKRDEIRIPAAALRPFETEAYFSGELKSFKTWLESLELPPTSEEFRRRAKDFAPVASTEVITRLMDFHSLSEHPDLEEVSRISRSWYRQVYKAAWPIGAIVEPLNGMMVDTGNERQYQALKKVLDDAKAETLALLKKPKKISREEWEVIAGKNRERRKKEYIRWYREKQAEEQRKAREGAAGKKKSEKKPKADE